MSTDPEVSPQTWADSLTPIELAHQLDRIAGDPHALDRHERAAVLMRAARVIRS